MSLLDHARAARILGETFSEAASELSQTDPAEAAAFHTMIALEGAYQRAADRMEAEVKRDARTYLDTSGCTLRHSLKTTKCPACGAAHG